MLRYVIKRLLLFFPTLLLVSCLTFFLSKQVPADQVDMLLSIQGIDDSSDSYVTEYDALYEKMNLHLPEFYFSVVPNYHMDTRNSEFNHIERLFISRLSRKKYSKTYISNLFEKIKEASGTIKNRLLNSIDLNQLKEKLRAFDAQLDPAQKSALITLIDQKDNYRIKWHYPIIRFNGLQNQYHKWALNVLRGEFGVSLLDTRPVTDKLWDAMKWSVVLLTLNLLFSLLIAFPIGVYNGVNPNSTFDKASNGFLFSFFAIPKFWLATLMIIFFTTAEYGSWTNIFPSVGRWYTDGAEGFLSMISKSWTQLILPLIILTIPDVAYLSRLIRSNVQEESNKEYIKTAQSKGLSLKRITTRHILPNSLIPAITLLVGVLPGAIASALVIEVIFNIPGIGRLMHTSILNADWAMVYPIVLIIGILAVILFLLGDIVIAFLNPKIKLG
ncbi:MAG: ABC transporter permease [Bacteroidota bacterium]